MPKEARRRRRLRTVLGPGRAALPLLCLLLGCGQPPQGTQVPSSRVDGEADAPTRPPNILLISIDSLRADHLGAYGYARDTSPHLDQLAREGALFERAWSTSSWTLPAHASLLASLEPGVHGLIHGRERLNPAVTLVSETLRDAGYFCAAVVSAGYVASRFGFDQGWQLFDDSSYRQEGEDSTRRRSTEIVERRARELLDRAGDAPFFLFLHFFDVHYDYVPPPPYDGMFDPAARGGIEHQGVLRAVRVPPDLPAGLVSRLEALYDGEIRALDEALGRLFAELERRGLADDTLVVVTADHGDEFLEHGQLGHRRNLYDTTLRVPLIVRWPRGRVRGGRYADAVTLLDVAPTLARAGGAGPAPTWVGRDLLGRLRGGAPLPPLETVADLTGSRRALLVEGRWKLIVRYRAGAPSGRPRLFDLAADPAELHDLAAARPALAAELGARLQTAVARQQSAARRLQPERVRLGAQAAAELRALGYL